MATVRFSGNLRSEILQTARQLFDTRIRAAKVNHPADWGERIYQLMLDKYLPQMRALPDGFFSTISEVRIAGASFKDNNDELVKYSTHLRFSVPRALMPHRVNPEFMGVSGSSSFSGDTLNLDDPRWKDFRVEYITYAEAIEAIEKEQKAFVDGVSKVINAYVTLAPALKAWPPLWDLLPDRTQIRHKQIVQKRSSAEVDLDTSALGSMSALVTRNKLLGGS